MPKRIPKETVEKRGPAVVMTGSQEGAVVHVPPMDHAIPGSFKPVALPNRVLANYDINHLSEVYEQCGWDLLEKVRILVGHAQAGHPGYSMAAMKMMEHIESEALTAAGMKKDRRVTATIGSDGRTTYTAEESTGTLMGTGEELRGIGVSTEEKLAAAFAASMKPNTPGMPFETEYPEPRKIEPQGRIVEVTERVIPVPFFDLKEQRHAEARRWTPKQPDDPDQFFARPAGSAAVSSDQLPPSDEGGGSGPGDHGPDDGGPAGGGDEEWAGDVGEEEAAGDGGSECGAEEVAVQPVGGPGGTGLPGGHHVHFTIPTIGRHDGGRSGPGPAPVGPPQAGLRPGPAGGQAAGSGLDVPEARGPVPPADGGNGGDADRVEPVVSPGESGAQHLADILNRVAPNLGFQHGRRPPTRRPTA